MADVTRRAFFGLGAAAAVATGIVGCAPQAAAPLPVPLRAPSHTWPHVTGASCIGAANGDFGVWRSKRVAIAATWTGDGKPWALQKNGEYHTWDRDLDFAPQYSFDRGFSWRALANGDYDDQLSRDLDRLKALWANRPGTLYYRFQHEFNGFWQPWAIQDDDLEAFVEGWRRFAAIFRSVFGYDERYRIVWCPGGGAPSRDLVRVVDAYPGSLYVDVIGIDYYDFFDCATEEEWQTSLTAMDGESPVGIETWRQFAEDNGKPLALPEWGQQYGDNPIFVRGMYDYLDQWRFDGNGSAAGRIVYDIYFNQRLKADASPATDGDFILQENRVDYPPRPIASAAYRELWAAWQAVPA